MKNLGFLCLAVLLHLAPPARALPSTTPVRAAIGDREPAPPDPLVVGRTWEGTWFDEKWCRVDVVQRDRAERTAALRVTGERRAIFRVEVTTSESGASLKIRDVRMVAPAPGERMDTTIDFKSGSGRLSGSDLKLSWRAKVKKPGYSGDWSTTVKARTR
jgi:hypothetical protein